MRASRGYVIVLLAAFFIVLLFCVVAADDAYSRTARPIITADSSQALRTPYSASALGPRAAIRSVFGRYAGSALSVAYCETGGTMDPRARGRAGERGLFQIHPIHFSWLDERRLFEPLYNARIAFRLSRGGRDWDAWACRP